MWHWGHVPVPTAGRDTGDIPKDTCPGATPQLPWKGCGPSTTCRGDTSSSHRRKGQRAWDVSPTARGAGDVSWLPWVEGTVHMGHVADGTCRGGMSLLSWGGGTVDMGHIPDGRCCWGHVLALRWEGWCCGMSQGTRPCSCGTVHVGHVTVNTTP